MAFKNSLEDAKILLGQSLREGSGSAAVAKLQVAVQNILNVLENAEPEVSDAPEVPAANEEP